MFPPYLLHRVLNHFISGIQNDDEYSGKLLKLQVFHQENSLYFFKSGTDSLRSADKAHRRHNVGDNQFPAAHCFRGSLRRHNPRLNTSIQGKRRASVSYMAASTCLQPLAKFRTVLCQMTSEIPSACLWGSRPAVGERCRWEPGYTDIA